MTPEQSTVYTAIHLAWLRAGKKKVSRDAIAKECGMPQRKIREIVTELIMQGVPIGRVGGYYIIETPEQAHAEKLHTKKAALSIISLHRKFKTLEQRLTRPQLQV